MSEPYDLRRFVDAQTGGTYERALAELRAGRKTSHWMWFVFPQLAGLGRSETAVRYAVAGVDEARAYATHALLGPRYDECCAALLGLGDVPMGDVLGQVDAQKLHSSLTLFAQVTSSPLIDQLIDRHFDGQPDPATLELI
ncbi:DUF1810 domain-containing protein [Aeromicrobium sp. NPDC092404]|uniref:DUF1810 domain-containing protein n=1 Tax=Aeromicrobium sp. NPDC092404 TaxID=3154976 RepID=UPI00343C0542